MFYAGTLQSGISKALQEAKVVACFVTDNLEESQLWEHEFLQEEPLKSSLEEQSVLLRLEAGSQEAGYLAAIFPLPKNPTLVVINNGNLKEYITTGVTKEEFKLRLSKALESRERQPKTPATSSSSVPTPAMPAAQLQISTNASSASNSVPAAAEPSNNESQQSRAVQALLAERSARLEAHKKEQEAKEKAKRNAEAKARKEALNQEAASASSSASSANAKYALMQRQRQQEAREERARILKRVEDDKSERRDRENARKAAAKAKLGGEAPSSNSAPSSSRSSSAECALQVRLFDGSTVRSRFSSQGNLRKDVRPWLDEKQVGDVPYTFKLVLSPLPNKNIETSEEEQTLQSLGLTPSATLIIVPVDGYTSAYEGASPGYLSRGVSAGYGLVSGVVGTVAGVLGSFLGGGGGNGGGNGGENRHRESDPHTATAPITSRRVRTLGDQEDRGRDDHQFYNGNALNFEPRADENDERKDD